MQEHSSSPLFSAVKYKEDPKYWTNQKVLEAFFQCEIDAHIRTIIENFQMSGGHLLNLSESEIKQKFHDQADQVKRIQVELQNFHSERLDNIDPDFVYMSESTEVTDSVYQHILQPQEYLIDHLNQDLSAVRISKIHQTQYFSSAQVPYNIFDFDEYPNLESSMQRFQEIIQLPSYLKLQEEYDTFLSNQFSVLIKMQLNETLIELNENKQYIFGSKKSECDILFRSKSVSEVHALIKCENKTFTLTDLGSRDGTFVRSEGLLELQKGSIFMCGNQQFQIANISFSKDSAQVELLHIEGLSTFIGKKYSFTITQGIMSIVGTIPKATLGNDMSADPKLAKLHSKFIVDNNKLFIQDLNKEKEATWIRISPSMQQSQQISLSNITEIKFSDIRVPIQLYKLNQNNELTQIKQI